MDGKSPNFLFVNTLTCVCNAITMFYCSILAANLSSKISSLSYCDSFVLDWDFGH